jgi:TPR repeat protein
LVLFARRWCAEGRPAVLPLPDEWLHGPRKFCPRTWLAHYIDVRSQRPWWVPFGWAAAVTGATVWFWHKYGATDITDLATVVPSYLLLVSPTFRWAWRRTRTKPLVLSPAQRALDSGRLAGFRLTGDGLVPTVRDLDPTIFGVKAAIHQHGPAGAPPYAPRDIDADLEWSIHQGGLTILHGRAAAGKSRSGYEALLRICPDRICLMPTTPHALRDLLEAGAGVENAIFWIDDLERYLQPGGIDLSTIDRLCGAGRHDVAIVATIRDEYLARYLQTSSPVSAGHGFDFGRSPIASDGGELIRQVGERSLIRVHDQLSPAEADAIAANSADARVVAAATQTGAGFGEYLAAGPALMDRWAIGDDPIFHAGQAVVSAAVNCRRAGIYATVSEALLRQLYLSYVPGSWRERADLPPFADAVAWACTPVLAASSCVQPLADGTYRAADYLVDRTMAGHGPLGITSISGDVWETVIATVDGDDVVNVGIHALQAREPRHARTAFQKAANAGSLNGMFSLGHLLQQEGQADEAIAWYLRAADAGHVDAMNNVAYLLEEAGDADAAERWYQRAAATGDPTAMANFGGFLAVHGQPVEAEKWLRRAAPLSTLGAYNLGVFLTRVPDGDTEARDWFGVAAIAGNANAAYNLGLLLSESDPSNPDAERWLREAQRVNVPGARRVLADLLSTLGRHTDAEYWYRQALDEGDISAWSNLGVMYAGLSRRDDAQHCYRQGAEAGDATAMYNLAQMLAQDGHEAEALAWFERAAEADDPDAMRVLGIRQLKRGEREAAQRLFRRSADLGNHDARVDLAAMLAEDGLPDEAERLYRVGASAGHQPSMTNLGVLLHVLERRAEGEEWLRRAADAGNIDAMKNLSVVLTQRGAHDEAQHWRDRSQVSPS